MVDDKTNKKATPGYSVVLSVIVGSAVGTLGFWIVVSLWIAHPITQKLWPYHGVFVPESSKPLSENEAFWVSQLLANERITTPANVMAQTMAFYDVLIAVLVTILAVVAGVAYIYIRGTSIRHSEETAEEAADRIIRQKFQTVEFAKQVDQNIVDRVSRPIADIEAYLDSGGTINEQLGDLNERVDSLQQQLAILEKRIATQDTEDQASGRVDNKGS